MTTLDCSQIFQRLSAEISKDEQYCTTDLQKSDRLRTILEELYAYSVSCSSKQFGPLDKLVVNGVDEESLWEELQTRNKPLLRFIEKKLKYIGGRLRRNQELQDLEERVVGGEFQENEEESDGREEVVNQEDHEDGEDDDDEDDEDEDSNEDEDEDEDDDESRSDEEESEIHEPKGRVAGTNKMTQKKTQKSDDHIKTGKGKTVVMNSASHNDDSEEEEEEEDSVEIDSDEELAMEAWLDATEELEQRHLDREERRERRMKSSTVDKGDWEEDDEEQEEDDIDFVQRALYEDDSGDDDSVDHADPSMDPTKIMYSDFYADEDEGDGDGEVNDDDDDDDMDEGGNDGDFSGADDYIDSEEEETEKKATKKGIASKDKKDESSKVETFETVYQRRARELKTQIAALEEEMMAEKSWELKGEVKASNRPDNSLLELAVDVER